MRIGVPREIIPDERRVAVTPHAAERLIRMGFTVAIEAGAGQEADFSDAAFAETGVEIVSDVESLWGDSDMILKVRPPDVHPLLGMYEADLIAPGGMLISFLWPAQNGPLLALLSSRGITAFAMDCVPRITRAQKLDALSAMANVAGYRAVIEAASVYPGFFSGQITAAGKVNPAKVLVIGGGVAGLAAIGAARALGAIVRAFDVRPAVREQVQSMGAEFLELDFEESGEGEGGYARAMSDEFIEAEMSLFAQQAMDVDIIITTALIPGKEAPKLITAGMVESMREGSVIVDLAAEQGGNCTLTVPGEVTERHGVTIVGYTDLVSRMATQASQLYATTVVNLVEELGGPAFHIDLEDEVIRSALVLHEGAVTWPPPRPKPAEKPVVAERPDSVDLPPRELQPIGGGEARRNPSPDRAARWIWLAAAAAALALVGFYAPEEFVGHFTVFVLACFVGWQVVWNVTPALHTPLMSMTNAISGIIVIGGMLQVSGGRVSTVVLGAVAVFIAMINVSGGLLVTKRMLAMFRR